MIFILSPQFGRCFEVDLEGALEQRSPDHQLTCSKPALHEHPVVADSVSSFLGGTDSGGADEFCNFERASVVQCSTLFGT